MRGHCSGGDLRIVGGRYEDSRTGYRNHRLQADGV